MSDVPNPGTDKYGVKYTELTLVGAYFNVNEQLPPLGAMLEVQVLLTIVISGLAPVVLRVGVAVKEPPLL